MPGQNMSDKDSISKKDFICPISLETYEDPILVAGYNNKGEFFCSGNSYSRKALLDWVNMRFGEARGELADPCVPNIELNNSFLIPNIALTHIIKAVKEGEPYVQMKDPVLLFYQGKDIQNIKIKNIKNIKNEDRQNIFLISYESYERECLSNEEKININFIPNRALQDGSHKKLLLENTNGFIGKKNIIFYAFIPHKTKYWRSKFFKAAGWINYNWENRLITSGVLINFIFLCRLFYTIHGKIQCKALSSTPHLPDHYQTSYALQPELFFKINDYLHDERLFSTNHPSTEVTNNIPNIFWEPVNTVTEVCLDHAIGKSNFFYFPHTDYKNSAKIPEDKPDQDSKKCLLL